MRHFPLFVILGFLAVAGVVVGLWKAQDARDGSGAPARPTLRPYQTHTTAGLLEQLRQAGPEDTLAIRTELTQRGRKAAVEVGGLLSQTVEASETSLRLIQVLGWTRTPAAEQALLLRLEADLPAERVALIEALGDCGGRDSVRALTERTRDLWNPETGARLGERLAAIRSLGMIGDPDGIPRLKELLEDLDPRVRVQAAEALALAGDPAGMDTLIRQAAFPQTHSLAMRRLELLTGYSFAAPGNLARRAGRTDVEAWADWWNAARGVFRPRRYWEPDNGLQDG